MSEHLSSKKYESELAGMRRQCEELDVAYTAVLRANEHLQEQVGLAEGMNAVLLSLLISGNWREAGAQILRRALDMTESEYGFIGVVIEASKLRIIAHEGVHWNQAVNRGFYKQAIQMYEDMGYLDFDRLDNLFGHVITSKASILTNDAVHDPRSRGSLPPGHPPLNQFLGVPAYHHGDVVGMIGVANRTGGYRVKDQVELEGLAKLVSRLFESYDRHLRETNLEAQLRFSQGRLLEVLEEREGFAHVLHDDIIQILYSTGCVLDGAAATLKVDDDAVHHVMNHAVDNLNGIIHRVRECIIGSTNVEQVPLFADHLVMLAERMKGYSGLSFVINVDSGLADRLGREQEYQILFIVQEAISNIRRHSQASEGQISLDFNGEMGRLTISDNGVGFSDEDKEPVGRGIALMRSRVSDLRGQMQFSFQKGTGMTVVVDFPLQKGFIVKQ